MSFFSLFTRKKRSADDRAGPLSSSFAGQDPTVPMQRRGGDAAPVSARRSERIARRELLFTVVRECMNRAGVLSASYKFKVLSLDARGREFLVMIEVPGAQLQSAERLAEIEARVAQAAKAQHKIAVKAVYWRQNDQIAVGQATGAAGGRKAAGVELRKPDAVAPDSMLTDGPGYEPIEAGEVAAFRQALANGSRPPREPRPATPQSYTLLTGFEHTELREDPPADVLSGSQYGELR
jgi:hypothetical protein